MFSIRRRYDETPLQLRIADSLQDSGTDTGSQTQCQSTTLSLLLTRESSPSLASTSSSKRTAKVMQSELFITALIKDKRSGGCLQISGKLPCFLQCLQNTKAALIAKSQLNIMAQIPNLESVSRKFWLRRMFVCLYRQLFGQFLRRRCDQISL